MDIELKNLRFCYPERPNQQVLNIPDWSLASKEKALIHGSSGGGKSTLLNLISGLLTPQQGQVTVLGERLDQMSSKQRDRFRAHNIGYVFQKFNLIPYLNAMDNIYLAHQLSKKSKASHLKQQTQNLLHELGISENDWTLPSRNLSIGQQQRVAIARALINKPKLLIADEPTSSLDPKNRNAFMDLLMSMVAEQKTTLLFVSHDMEITNYFSRVEALTEINRIEDME